MAIKPHLVYLFWIAVAVWAIRRPVPMRWKVIAGGIVAGLIATAIPMACNPDVLGQYWEAMTHRTPEQWKSPTIGSYLRVWYAGEEGRDYFKLQYLPAFIGFVWLALESWRTRHREWNWREQMPMILLVSFVTASYGAWPFDLVILLPAVVVVAGELSRSGDRRTIGLALLAYIAINGAALAMNLAGMTSDNFIWMAPAILLAYVLFRPRLVSP
jgi:hypothetical protein